MSASLRTRLLHALSLAFVALPFAFALIRAVETGGRDLRYVWVALAASFGAAVSMWSTTAARAKRTAAGVVAAAVFGAATLLAVIAALLLGTRLGPGILVVGSAFGFCFAVAGLLHVWHASESV